MPGDDPIIVNGGGSVTAEYSDDYKPESSTKGKKKIKNKDVNLDYLEIRSKPGQRFDLDPNDMITIHTK
ncbi:MAG: hypothetical protein LC742_08905 [Acidobacteria bacterium]|nr:hypothetical protein [Acidobacteriota bacterium]